MAADRQPRRVLGIDFGERRIGLAVSDSEAAIAFPAGHLVRSRLPADLAALGALAREREIARIVVGLPLHMDGREGDMAAAARTFAGELAEATGLPVELLDERWTTREAERALAGSGRGRRRAADLDAAAATILLRTYLDRQRNAAAGNAP